MCPVNYIDPICIITINIIIVYTFGRQVILKITYANFAGNFSFLLIKNISKVIPLVITNV